MKYGLRTAFESRCWFYLLDDSILESSERVYRNMVLASMYKKAGREVPLVLGSTAINLETRHGNPSQTWIWGESAVAKIVPLL